MKKVYILVGINGSGKSTAAKKLTESGGVVVSADNYMVDEHGKWRFDPTRLSLCHSLCQEAFHEALHKGESLIVVDNTNLCHDHRWIYAKHALEHGYEVTMLVFDIDIEVALKRNIHGVPRHTLENQKRKLDLASGVYNLFYDSLKVSA